MGLEAQQAGQVGEHRPRIRFGEALALEKRKERLGMAPAHTRDVGRHVRVLRVPLRRDPARRRGALPTEGRIDTAGGKLVPGYW